MAIPIIAVGNPGQTYYVNNTTYVAAVGSGLISNIALNDLQGLIDAGCMQVSGRRVAWIVHGTIKAANATGISASAALSNGAVSIAAQPDVPRPVQGVFFPGAAAITAGSIALTYNDESGIPRTDTVSLIAPLTTPVTFTTSHGVAGGLAATVSGLVGGSTPGIQLGTNANVAVSADENDQGLTFFKAVVDQSDDTLPVIVGGNIITPHTVPNGTHTYTFGYYFYTG